eukprot:8569018-Heterocapsa_arctica.AAC.1
MKPTDTRSWLNSSRPTPAHNWEERSERRAKLLETVKAKFPFPEERFRNNPNPMPNPWIGQFRKGCGKSRVGSGRLA